MSYDVSLRIDTGGRHLVDVVDCGNMTYNVGAMYVKALGGKGLRDLDGVEAWKVVTKLEAAVKHMEEFPAEYEKLNPSNGWGDYKSALEYLEGIYKRCKENPKCVISVH